MALSSGLAGQNDRLNGLGEAFGGRDNANGISFDDLVKQLSDKNSPITKAVEKGGNDSALAKEAGVDVEDGITRDEAEKLGETLEEMQSTGDANKNELSLAELVKSLLGEPARSEGRADPAGGTPSPAGAAQPTGGSPSTAGSDSAIDKKVKAAADELGMEADELEQLLDKDKSGKVEEAEFKPLEDLFGDDFLFELDEGSGSANGNSPLRMLA